MKDSEVKRLRDALRARGLRLLKRDNRKINTSNGKRAALALQRARNPWVVLEGLRRVSEHPTLEDVAEYYQNTVTQPAITERAVKTDENRKLKQVLAELDAALEENHRLKYVATEHGTALNRIEGLEARLSYVVTQHSDAVARANELEARLKDAIARVVVLEGGLMRVVKLATSVIETPSKQQ